MNEQNYRNGDALRKGMHSEEAPKSHSILLQNRARLEISGVSDVIRFDELSAELSTVLGELFVEGEGLRIEGFDTERGSVTLTGKIRTLDYFDLKESSVKGEKKRGLFGKR